MVEWPQTLSCIQDRLDLGAKQAGFELCSEAPQVCVCVYVCVTKD